MKTFFYPAIFHKEDIGYSVSVPDIDGCFTQGDTLDEASEMAFDAIGLCLEDYEAQGKAYPQPSDPSNFETSPGDYIVLIKYDDLTYKRKSRAQSVKKTLTIPSWLNDIAEEKHLNFSSILKQALISQLGISE